MYKIIIHETADNKEDFADKLYEIAKLIKNGHSYPSKFSIVKENDFVFVETSDRLESKIKVLIESNPDRFPYDPFDEPFIVLGDEEVDSIDIDGVSTTECDYGFGDLYQADLQFIYDRLVKYCQE